VKRIRLADRNFELSIPYEDIEYAISTVASDMNRDLKDSDPLMICVLNGSFMFAADLMKKLTFPCQITFVKLSSYEGTQSTGKVKSVIGLTESIKDRTIVVLEDIIDTGVTMTHVLKQLNELGPKEIKVAALFYKPDVCRCEISIDYVGMSIPDDFVVGFGLDYKGYGRNLTDLYTVVEE
jgi:hypoxanthine phosphoribosyltransferase